MTGRIRSNATLAAVVTGVLAATAPSLRAQTTGTVEGRVTDLETGRIVPGITVVVDGTELRAQTDRTGRYRLTGVPAGPVKLRVEVEDYGSTVESISVAGGDVTVFNIRLAGVSAILDRLLVAATPAVLSNRERGATVREVRPTRGGRYSLGALLRGRVPGLSVSKFNGQAGSGYRLLLRGVNSISLDNEPLVYLDGILVAGPTTRQQGRANNVLNMVDPFSIDHIEVLSGPAASVRYGAGAANGVIMIHTKRGRQG